MKILNTPLADLKIIELDVFGDSRGFFVERFSSKKFADNNLPTQFLQDNHSRSAAGVLRGLHFQPSPAQGKLVGCVNGRIWDVAVDIRADSATYGQYFGLELSCKNGKLLWIPAGFAHGFCVLGDKPADVYYKCTSLYNPQGETGIAWNDPDFAIAWPFDNMVEDIITSDRDTQQQSFADYRKNPAKW